MELAGGSPRKRAAQHDQRLDSDFDVLVTSSTVDPAQLASGKNLLDSKAGLNTTQWLDKDAGPAGSDPAPRVLEKSRRRGRGHPLALALAWFNTYRQLFTLVLCANAVLMALAAAKKFGYGNQHALGWTVGNVLLSVACRNEVFLFGLYWGAVNTCRTLRAPLWLKHRTTDFLLHIGGIHSGCGVSSLLWAGLAIANLAKHPQLTTVAIKVIASVVLALLAISCIIAFPLIRWYSHNVFELVHRFAGWSSLALLWVLVVLADSFDAETRTYSAHALVHRPELWMTSVLTILIIMPWLTVRKVKVESVVPSKGYTILKFEGGVKDGMLGRIARPRGLILEWHAFGIMSAGPASGKHAMLCVARGDFTKALNSNPPNHLWVRTFRFAGLPFCGRMYNRLVVVATGAGIGVVLSSMLQLPIDLFFIWVAKDIPSSYGEEILNLVDLIPPERLQVIDTALGERPDIPALAADRAAAMQAEAVFITSNEALTAKIWRGCQTRGVRAFGPIWDS